MSITPSALFLFCCILRVKTLIESKRVTKHAVDILSAFKLVSGLVLLAGTSACVALAPRVGWGKWATVGYSLDLLATVSFKCESFVRHAEFADVGVFHDSVLFPPYHKDSSELNGWSVYGFNTAFLCYPTPNIHYNRDTSYVPFPSFRGDFRSSILTRGYGIRQ